MDIRDQLLAILKHYLPRGAAIGVLTSACRAAHWQSGDPSDRSVAILHKALRTTISLYVREPAKRDACLADTQAIIAKAGTRLKAGVAPVHVSIRDEAGIVKARSMAQRACEQLGFSRVDQIKVATVVSELARNIIQYAAVGEIHISSMTNSQGGVTGVLVVAEDNGPGIKNLDEILAGHYRSPTGLGKGITGSRQLMDRFQVRTSTGGADARGTTIRALKRL